MEQEVVDEGPTEAWGAGDEGQEGCVGRRPHCREAGTFCSCTEWALIPYLIRFFTLSDKLTGHINCGVGERFCPVENRSDNLSNKVLLIR